MLSSLPDAHLPPVHAKLQELGRTVLICDLADFPENIRLSGILSEGTGWQGQLHFQEHSLSWDNIQSIWWRRPQRYHTQKYASAIAKHIEQEAYYGFLGLLLQNPHAQQPLWVSHPHLIRTAEFKISQLALAQHLGLQVPPTLIWHIS